MNPRSTICRLPAVLLALCASAGFALADHFRTVPLDEGPGLAVYQIVDAKGAAVLTVRDRAEYASGELRARDIASRLNRAIDNLQEHGNLLFLVDWAHGQPTIHQVSRDGMIRFMIVGFTAADLESTKRREGPSDLLELARAMLDSIESAVESTRRTGEPEIHGMEPEASAILPGAAQGAAALQGTEVIKEAPPEEARETEHENTPAPSPPSALAISPPMLPGASPSVKEEPPEGAQSSALRLRVEPPDAVLYLDNKFQPLPESGPIPVTPGRHTIELVRPGYQPFRKVITVPPEQVVRIALALESAPAHD